MIIQTKEFSPPSGELRNYLIRQNLAKITKGAPFFLIIGSLGLILTAFKFFFVGFLAIPLIMVGSSIDLWRELRAAKKLAGTKFQYEITENSFKVLAGNRASQIVKTDNFRKAILDKSGFYLLYPSKSNTDFFVLPLDAFHSPIDQEIFEEFLIKKRLIKK